MNHAVIEVLAGLAALATVGLAWWIAHSAGRSAWPGWLLACAVFGLLFTLATTGSGTGAGP